MDQLRSCYRSQMRLYADRPDILTWGRWYRCPPGAIDAPASVFYSRRWDDLPYGDAPLGEVYQRYYQWTNGKADPRLTGQHYCGSTAWTQGILYADRPGLVLDATGVPLCCSALAPAPGGVRIGGRGSFAAPPAIFSGSLCGCGTSHADVSVFP